MCTITALEEMHPHAEARGRSFPAASRLDRRFPLSSLNGACCNISCSARGYARPCLAPFALHDEDTYWCLPRLFLFFPRVFSIFFHLCFSSVFFSSFTQEAAKGPTFINKFSSAIYWIRARIALLSPPNQIQTHDRHFFHIQLKYFSRIEQETNTSTKQ